MNARGWLAVAGFVCVLGFQACVTPPKHPPPAPPAPPRAGVAAPEGPVVSPPPGRERGANALYRRAEGLYSQGRWREAAGEYTRFIATSAPDDHLMDNAYFKAGMSWLRLGRYRDALYNFQAMLEKYPGSGLRAEAMINAGVCYYHLNDYDKAEDFFSRAWPLITDPGHKAYIHFYRAAMAERRGDFMKALKLYVRSERSSDDDELIELARSKTARLVHNFLGEKDLLEMTKLYPGLWPAELAFGELANIYRRSGDEAALSGIEERRKEQFARKLSGGAGQLEEREEEAQPAPVSPEIGVVAPLSGKGARAGMEVVQGIQLAVGSFHDMAQEKNLQLIIKDSASDVETARRAMEELAQDSDTLVILGPVFSRAFERAAGVADEYRIPVFSSSSNAEGLASLSPWLFRNTITNSGEAKKIAGMAVTRLGLKKFAVIYPDNLQGWEIFDSFRDEVNRLGGSVEAEEKYHPTQTDFGEQIRNIGGMSDDSLRKIILRLARSFPEADPEYINYMLEERYNDSLTAPRIEKYGSLPLTSKNFLPALDVKFDAIFLPGSYDKVGLILPELEFYNIKGPVKLAGRGANNPELVTIAERYAEGLIMMDGFFKDSGSPMVETFTRNYKLAFREEPTVLAAQAYDAARMVLSGIAHGVKTRMDMRRYLENIRFFEGVSGTTSIRPDGDADKSVFFLTVKDGGIVEYTPPDAVEPETGDVSPEKETAPPALTDQPSH